MISEIVINQINKKWENMDEIPWVYTKLLRQIYLDMDEEQEPSTNNIVS